MIPIHKQPLCKCADTSMHCLGRQPGVVCMAHDRWYVTPCDEGKCPGPMHPDCCHKSSAYEDAEE